MVNGLKLSKLKTLKNQIYIKINFFFNFQKKNNFFKKYFFF